MELVKLMKHNPNMRRGLTAKTIRNFSADLFIELLQNNAFEWECVPSERLVKEAIDSETPKTFTYNINWTQDLIDGDSDLWFNITIETDWICNYYKDEKGSIGIELDLQHIKIDSIVFHFVKNEIDLTDNDNVNKEIIESLHKNYII